MCRDAARSAVSAGLLLVGALAVVLAAAAPAAAHAQLTATVPADGEVLPAPPPSVELRFNEPVRVPDGAVRVYDTDGAQLSGGGDDDPRAEVVALDVVGLEHGTYVVTYRVASADGHPIKGAFVFSVGREGRASDDLVAALLDGGADRPFAIGAAVVRWVLMAGVLVAAGVAGAAVWVRAAAGAGIVRLRRPLRVAAGTTIVATLLGVLLQAALVEGSGLRALVDVGGIADTLGSPYGWSALLRTAGAVLVLVRVAELTDPGRRADVVGLVGAVAVAASLLLDGHTLTTQPAWLVVGADAVHVAAGATWMGGLVALAVLVRARRREDDPVGAGRLVARFSVLATAAVVGVTVGGTALAWVEVRALHALTSTPYGWTLVAKLVVVAPLLALGWVNHRHLVPAIAAAVGPSGAEVHGWPVPAGGADAPGPAAAWARLRRTVSGELVLLAVVLAVTAVLVNLQPAASEAGIGGAFSTTTALGEIGRATVTVDPNRVGANEIHLYLLGTSGRPQDIAESVALELEHPALDIGPITREPLLAGPGHYVLAGPELSVPGRWRLTIVAEVSRFEVVERTVEFTVNR